MHGHRASSGGRAPRLIGALLVLALTAPVTAAVGAPRPQAVPAERYGERLANGSFEDPVLAVGEERAASNGWRFVGSAGVTRLDIEELFGTPPAPNGPNVAILRDSSAVLRTVSLAPGDRLTLRATQRVRAWAQPLVLEVHVDGRLVGTVTPSTGRWGRHVLPLGVDERGVSTVEIRGALALEGDERAAFVDDIGLMRRSSSIPDAGLPAEEMPVVLSDRTTPTAAGVAGSSLPEGTDSHPRIQTPVQAMAEWVDPVTGRSVVFVGGKFDRVMEGRGADPVEQKYLAAFDGDTGAWIKEFRPRLDGAVWDLAVTSDGLLIVGGQFTRVGRVADTSALAALDPATGTVVRRWRANVGLTGSLTGERPIVRALDIDGDWIYVGGNFTRIGPEASARKVGRLMRVSVVDGEPDLGFRPDIQLGSVWAIDATPDAVWVGGTFGAVEAHGVNVPFRALAKLSVLDGRPAIDHDFFRPTRLGRRYQSVLSILARPDGVWVAGEQHTLQIYRPDGTFVKQWINSPIGDMQTLDMIGDVVYAGNHGGRLTSTYENAPSSKVLLGATAVDYSPWIGAYHADAQRRVTGWSADVIVAHNEGAWESLADSRNCLWLGGDFTGGSPRPDGRREFARGFLRFCPRDSVAPRRPSGLTATATWSGVQLRWSGPSAPVEYEVFRNDRLVAHGLSDETWTDASGGIGDRWFVRAVDAAGNRSATTPAAALP